jgi:hypothetical protein
LVVLAQIAAAVGVVFAGLFILAAMSAVVP